MKVDPNGPNGVHFIQFIFPNGRRSDQWIQRPPDIFEKARALWAAGYRLEIENKDGQIWMSCVKHSDDAMAFDRLCANGPEVPEKVDELIIEAYESVAGN
jgi:hypothetical protein